MKTRFFLSAAICLCSSLFVGCAPVSTSTEQTSSAAMYVTVNSNKLTVTLEDNSSVAALVEILRQNDITYTATDYGDFEKVGNISAIPCQATTSKFRPSRAT